VLGRNYPPGIIHQVIEQIRTLVPQGKEDGLQTLVNLRLVALGLSHNEEGSDLTRAASCTVSAWVWRLLRQAVFLFGD
jgi:hypothetical protein